MQVAYEHAAMILNWQENLPSSDMPPQYLWLSDDGLVEWFDQVDARRESGAVSADPTSNWEEVEMDENEEAIAYKRSLGIM